MFDSLSSLLGGLLSEPNLLLFFALFFIFIILAYKVVKLLVRALIVAVIAGLFPFFANMFLGMSIPITIGNVIWFSMTGVEIFFVYTILMSIGKIASIITSPFRGGKKKVEKVIIMEKSKDKHEGKGKQERE
jgi:hypothetical protein